jgi:hypothetical protein
VNEVYNMGFQLENGKKTAGSQIITEKQYYEYIQHTASRETENEDEDEDEDGSEIKLGNQSINNMNAVTDDFAPYGIMDRILAGKVGSQRNYLPKYTESNPEPFGHRDSDDDVYSGYEKSGYVPDYGEEVGGKRKRTRKQKNKRGKNTKKIRKQKNKRGKIQKRLRVI